MSGVESARVNLVDRRSPPYLLEAPQGESLPGLLTPRLTAPRRLKVTAHSALVADYATGLTQVQIAEKYGLHVQTVRKRLIAAGVDTRARLRVLTDEDLWAARAAIDDGASVRETARGLGVAHTTITRLLARHHEAPKSPLRTTKAGPRTSTTSVRIRRSPLRTTSETPSDQGNVKANQPQHRNAGAGPWVPK